MKEHIESIVDNIKRSYMNKKMGYFNCIPFTDFKKLSEHVHGITKGTYWIITANSGVGKSQLTRHMFIHQPISYVNKLSPEKIKLSIKYFSLEESREQIILLEISKYLYSKYNIKLTAAQIASISMDDALNEDILMKIDEAKDYLVDYLSKVEIIDNIRNPFGIFKEMRRFALEHGTFYKLNGEALTPENVRNIITGKGDDYKIPRVYKTYHPNHYMIVIVDHLSLLSAENGNSKWATLEEFSSKYLLALRDIYKFCVVIVQQQASDKERIESNLSNVGSQRKLEPSLDGLGDIRVTQRDTNIVLGLFSPHRYGIVSHNTYDITHYKDNYRSLTILKNRSGIANISFPLYFMGSIGHFEEIDSSSGKFRLDG